MQKVVMPRLVVASWWLDHLDEKVSWCLLAPEQLAKVWLIVLTRWNLCTCQTVNAAQALASRFLVHYSPVSLLT